MAYSTKIEVAPKIIMTFEGDTVAEFEEDIRAGCLFAERCKFNQVRMMKEESGFLSIKNAADAISKVFGFAGKCLFPTPVCETAKKFYDFDAHSIKTGVPGIIDDECVRGTGTPEMPKAKSSKSEEGTVHLSPDMTTDELAEAIGKGGMKTIDLDDVDELRKLLAAARKAAAK